MVDFDAAFRTLTGNAPFPWQSALYDRFAAGDFPASCNLPTGLGKTNVIAVWLIALANHADKVPRRLVYVVNRRTVVDQTTDVAEGLRHGLLEEKAQELLKRLMDLSGQVPVVPYRPEPVALSTLRGQFADNREWSADPSRPAIICGTVDMIGSRLLFGGYGLGFKSRPLHAGFLGQDVLLVHDEAHLEPAFQRLIEAIRDEQRRNEWERDRFRVMALTATSRDANASMPFRLTAADDANAIVAQRLNAKKILTLHPVADDKAVVKKVIDLAVGLSGAVLVFVRTVEGVNEVVASLKKAKVPDAAVCTLTGTMRGLERDNLARSNPVFARFLPKPEVTPRDGTVYLVCTAAGEVGVDISADHFVSDLTPFDSMAQRFGRVNRYGTGDARIEVVRPIKYDEKDKLADARARTATLLQQLPDGDASPASLGRLPDADKLAAFTPLPTILPSTDILFDAWALTTVKAKLPGRPKVEPYLHGQAEWEPPQTVVGWRQEVGLLTEELRAEYDPADVLEDYPLKPHETLQEPSSRAADKFKKLAVGGANLPAWLIDDDDTVTVLTVADLADKDRIARKTVLLPPAAGGLDPTGMLSGAAEQANDVADEWYVDPARTRKRRERQRSGSLKSERLDGMRWVRTIDLKPDSDDSDTETADRFWHWYEAVRDGDTDGSKAAQKPVALSVHVADVVGHAERIVGHLPLVPQMKEAVVLAAYLHDLGKDRQPFQAVLGNPLRKQPLLAKSGRKGGRVKEKYRHEFGSLADIADDKLPHLDRLNKLPEAMRELVLHLIATHHGRGRPHFPKDEAFDPHHPDTAAVSADVPRRFARLQRKYGRWGLAYLESLLRAADYAASGNPSEFVEGEE